MGVRLKHFSLGCRTHAERSQGSRRKGYGQQLQIFTQLWLHAVCFVLGGPELPWNIWRVGQRLCAAVPCAAGLDEGEEQLLAWSLVSEVAEKGFLPELLQFSHPDESFREVRGQMTVLELLAPKRPFCCANQLQTEFQERKAVLRKMCLWKNRTFQLLPSVFLMRRNLEERNSSSSSVPVRFSEESGLLGRLRAGTSHSKSLGTVMLGLFFMARSMVQCLPGTLCGLTSPPLQMRDVG